MGWGGLGERVSGWGKLKISTVAQHILQLQCYHLYNDPFKIVINE